MSMNESHFKTPEVFERNKLLCTKLLEIQKEMFEWLNSQGVFGVITCAVSLGLENDALGRVSKSHLEGRAFDLRCRDWTPEMKQAFRDHFNHKFGQLGAVGFQSGIPTLILHHDSGHGEHFHVQLNRSFAVKIAA